MPAAARDRSRSPVAQFSKKELPKVKTWVLCRTERRVNKDSWAQGKWKDAVPALVSKVAKADTLQGEETRVNVLVPNLLSLQYNFKAAAYRELQDLKISDVRPYRGKDQDRLKEALLKAVQARAKTRTATPESEVEKQTSIEQHMQSIPAKAEQADADKQPELPEQTAAPPAAVVPESTLQADVQPAMDDIEEEKENVEVEKEADHGQQEMQMAQVDTPATEVPVRTLERRVTPLTSAPMDSAPTPPKIKAKAVPSKERLRDATAAIAKALHASGDGMLSKAELVDSSSVKTLAFDMDEFEDVLKKLDAMNKIMLNDDIVFAV